MTNIRILLKEKTQGIQIKKQSDRVQKQETRKTEKNCLNQGGEHKKNMKITKQKKGKRRLCFFIKGRKINGL